MFQCFLVVDFERRESGEVDKEGLEQFIEDYENYKDPHNMNRWFVDNVEERGTQKTEKNDTLSTKIIHLDLKFKSRLRYLGWKLQLKYILCKMSIGIVEYFVP